MGWVTMSSSDAVNLVYQLSHILEKSSKRKINKILNLQLKQMKTPLKNNNNKKKTKTLPSCITFAKQPGHWKRDCYKFKLLALSGLLTSFSIVLLILKEVALRKYRRLLPTLPLNHLREMFLQTGTESLPVLTLEPHLSAQLHYKAAVVSEY